MQCDACPATAIVDQPYRGAHLCGVHLMESVRVRARHEMHQQFPRFRGGVVAVALSGGKDSAAALYLTHAYFRRRTNVRIVAITVDEGIQGYRPATIAAAAKLAGSLDVEHLVVRSKDRLGVTTDEVARARPQTVPCSVPVASGAGGSSTTPPGPPAPPCSCSASTWTTWPRRS